jgi:hypothetical protein
MTRLCVRRLERGRPAGGGALHAPYPCPLLGPHDLVEVADEHDHAANEHDQYQRPPTVRSACDETLRCGANFRVSRAEVTNSAHFGALGVTSCAAAASRLLENTGDKTSSLNRANCYPQRTTSTFPRPLGARQTTTEGRVVDVPSVLQEET